MLAQSFEWLPRKRGAGDAHNSKAHSRARTAALCLLVFLTAFGVRFLQWQDQRHLAVTTYMALSQYYVDDARPLTKGELGTFLTSPDPARDQTVLTHPPGYAILMAAAAALFGERNVPLQIFQIGCDAASAALVFLIAAELLSTLPALFAGLFVAFSPQLGFYSLLLLPDSPSVAPVLLSFLMFVRGLRRPRLWRFAAAGALVGLSCWLRSNAMLLAPFLALVAFFLSPRGGRSWRSLALAGAAALVIAPITLRNFVVFHQFIPLSLGTGVTLVEGIGEYDREGRFGLPNSDLNVQRQEAALYNRPEYIEGLYKPDGIERERLRRARGLAAIRSNPSWFLKVMLQRVAFMAEFKDPAMPEFKVRPDAAIDAQGLDPDALTPARSYTPGQLVSTGVVARPTHFRLEDGGDSMYLEGDFFPFWTDHIVSEPVPVRPDSLYVVRVPFKLDSGRAIFSVMSADLGTELASVVTPNPDAVRDTTDQPPTEVRLPFYTGGRDSVCVVLRDGAMGLTRLGARVGRLDILYAGPAAPSWTHYPRLFTRGVQQVLEAAWIVPFAAVGVVLLLLAGRGRELTLLLAVPVYFVGVQSFLHFEPRYILAVTYFLAVLAVLPLCWVLQILFGAFTNRRRAAARAESPAQLLPPAAS
jgi:hypothetical protein